MTENQMNRYREFESWYSDIIADFGFDREMDKKARDYLHKIIQERTQNWNIKTIINEFKEQIRKASNILIHGCGPSLESTINKLIKRKFLENYPRMIHLAADGASVLLRSRSIPILGLFTDLDGISQEEFKYADYVIVHAHGDNIKKLKEFKNQIVQKKNVIGTTQVKPKGSILTPGGFTDGDRILYFIRDLISPHQKLFLIGMDFKANIGKYSKPYLTHNIEANSIKRKKLKYAMRLTDAILGELDNPVYFVNSDPISEIKNFYYLSFDEFEKKIGF